MKNGPATRSMKSRLIWHFFGMVVGVLIGYVASHSMGPPLGCGRGEVRVLTKDLTLGDNEYVRAAPPAVAGTITRGSELQVKARLGGRVYVSFDALLPNDVLAAASVAASDSPSGLQRRTTTNAHGDAE